MPLCLSTFTKAYSSKNINLIEKLESIYEFLPESSRNYISNKMKEAPADAKIFKITNSFQKKAVENILIQSPTLKTADKLYRTFVNCKDYFDKFTSLFFLYKILSDRSELFEDKYGLLEFKGKIAKKSIFPFEHVLSSSFLNVDAMEKLLKITPQIDCEEYILDIFNKLSSQSVYYLYNFTNNEEIINKIDFVVGSNTEVFCKGFNMRFDNMSEDLKELLIEENKRQFFIEHPMWNLSTIASEEP